MDALWEIAGWTGAALILTGYLAVSMGWLKAGRRFQAANLIGACAFIANGAVHEAWPSVVTNIAWFLISAIALLRMQTARQPLRPTGDVPQTQFPGVPDTGQFAVVDSGSPHLSSSPSPGNSAPCALPAEGCVSD